jgi:excisionase family DNA binding protein
MTTSATLPRNGRQLVFTSSQAASYLGVSLATIRRWTDAGHIACYRTPGGQRRFARQQLDEFMNSMHRDGAAEHGPAPVVQHGPSAKVACRESRHARSRRGSSRDAGPPARPAGRAQLDSRPNFSRRRR